MTVIDSIQRAILVALVFGVAAALILLAVRGLWGTEYTYRSQRTGRVFTTTFPLPPAGQLRPGEYIAP